MEEAEMLAAHLRTLHGRRMAPDSIGNFCVANLYAYPPFPLQQFGQQPRMAPDMRMARRQLKKSRSGIFVNALSRQYWRFAFPSGLTFLVRLSWRSLGFGRRRHKHELRGNRDESGVAHHMGAYCNNIADRAAAHFLKFIERRIVD
jgi:hypothetical protein